jgi:hypothetical protein
MLLLVERFDLDMMLYISLTMPVLQCNKDVIQLRENNAWVI